MKTFEFKDYLKRTFYHPSRNNEFPNGRAAIYDNKKNDLYTDKEQGSLPYGGIIFAICKMFEQSIDYDIKEGFTKSIVDSKDRVNEYKKDAVIGIHHGI